MDGTKDVFDIVLRILLVGSFIYDLFAIKYRHLMHWVFFLECSLHLCVFMIPNIES